MPETLTQPRLDDLTAGVTETWEGMFGLALDAIDAYPDAIGEELTAVVHIHGDVEWTVVVRLPRPLAHRIAGAMFDCDGADLGADEVSDAVGEIANVVAGFVKGRIEAQTSLSLPAVTEGRDLRVVVPGTDSAAELVAATDGHPFSVSILTRSL